MSLQLLQIVVIIFCSATMVINIINNNYFLAFINVFCVFINAVFIILSCK